MSRVYIPEMTWEEVGEALKEAKVAVIPVGSMEQHGPHLPLQSDTVFVLYICRKAAEEVYPIALVTPPVSIGISRHHIKFPGTLTLRHETLIDLLMDVGWSLKQHGVKKVALINGHGGNNPVVKIAARKMFDELGLLTASLSYWELLPIDKAEEIIDTFRVGHAGHACEFETSLSYVIQPESIRKERIGQSEEMEPLPYQGFLSLSMLEMSKTGVPRGDPRKASREKGEKILGIIIREMAAFLKSFGELQR